MNDPTLDRELKEKIAFALFGEVENEQIWYTGSVEKVVESRINSPAARNVYKLFVEELTRQKEAIIGEIEKIGENEAIKKLEPKEGEPIEVTYYVEAFQSAKEQAQSIVRAQK